jgi:hypothetical protein
MAHGGDPELSDEEFDRALGEDDALEHGEDSDLRDVPLDDDEARGAS